MASDHPNLSPVSSGDWVRALAQSTEHHQDRMIQDRVQTDQIQEAIQEFADYFECATAQWFHRDPSYKILAPTHHSVWVATTEWYANRQQHRLILSMILPNSASESPHAALDIETTFDTRPRMTMKSTRIFDQPIVTVPVDWTDAVAAWDAWLSSHIRLFNISLFHSLQNTSSSPSFVGDVENAFAHRRSRRYTLTLSDLPYLIYLAGVTVFIVISVIRILSHH